ncbi:MAG: PA14 domain-containing protein [bacterium]
MTLINTIKILLSGIIILCFISIISFAQKEKMVITYCDGTKQSVTLEKAKVEIKSFEFTCSTVGNDEGTVFGSTEYNPNALEGKIFYLPNNSAKLPDFSKLNPVGTIYTRKLDVPSQAFDKGFPGVTDRFEWFALRYTGVFNANVSGEYKFRLNSDDGSKLYVDGKLVIDNDGQHGPRSMAGSINLTKGSHNIIIEYFQGPRTHICLQFFITEPGGKERIF